MTQHQGIKQRALAILHSGVPNRVVAAELNVPRGTVGYRLHMDRAKRGELPGRERPSRCPRCDGLPLDRKAYSYLLGLYLGDGHIVSKYKQHTLSVYCADAWPGLIVAAEEAMKAVMPHYKTGLVQRQGCKEVKSYSKHWTCLFPQHGPGKKHNRLIALEPWQQEVVEEHPWELIRGFIHSDGCRIINWTTRITAGEKKRYEYPRYFFTNVSDDIRGICGEALDRVGVEWKTVLRYGKPLNISVARKASVALMEAHIGPKY